MYHDPSSKHNIFSYYYRLNFSFFTQHYIVPYLQTSLHKNRASYSAAVSYYKIPFAKYVPPYYFISLLEHPDFFCCIPVNFNAKTRKLRNVEIHILIMLKRSF